MLSHIAVADAYGVGFEFRPPAFVAARNDLSRYYPHARYRSLHARYSDDTQMTLAIAELMVSGETWTKSRIADHFVEAFHRDPRRGYSKRFYAILQASTTGEQLIGNLTGFSERNGAAMRAGVIGLYANTEEVLEKATLQARVTHDTEPGIQAACAAALLTHYFAHDLGPRTEVGTYLAAALDNDRWKREWQGKVTGFAYEAVQAAITALRTSRSQADLLRRCIAFTGDVDTVAAIAFAAAPHCVELAADLPDWLFTTLREPVYGIDYLSTLEKKLRAG